jgi:hypothetical protein
LSGGVVRRSFREITKRHEECGSADCLGSADCGSATDDDTWCLQREQHMSCLVRKSESSH